MFILLHDTSALVILKTYDLLGDYNQKDVAEPFCDMSS